MDRKKQYVLTNWSKHQEEDKRAKAPKDAVIVNVRAANKSTAEYIQQNWQNWRKNKSSIIVGDFNIPLWTTDSIKQKIKDVKNSPLSNSIKWTFIKHSAQQRQNANSSVHIGLIVDDNTNLNKF